MAPPMTHSEHHPPTLLRRLSVEEKYQLSLAVLTGDLSHRQAARAYGVDRSTVARTVRVAAQGARTALASIQPGRPRKDVGGRPLAEAHKEIARLKKQVHEQASRLAALQERLLGAGEHPDALPADDDSREYGVS